MDAAGRSRIADPSLAAAGEQRIRWVAKHSPVLNRLARTRLADGALRSRRVAVVVHLEAKTAYLALLLAETGAQVVAAGSNPGSTQDSICAALVARGLEVHASHDASRDQFDADLLAVADTQPELVVDDGAELTARILEHRPELAARLAGVSEETTTGVARLRAMEAAGRLTFPAIAANDARCKHLFDNRYGTGQSTLAAIDRLTNLNFAGREFCIVGYGWVGKGLARYARGQGGRVTVVEIEPIAALEAHMDGHRVARLEDALPDADVAITATGAIDAVPAEAIPLLKDGVLLANGGHHEREIAIDALGPGIEARPGVLEHAIPGGGSAYVLVYGRQTNVAGGDGHPVEIMDLSFSVQALAVHLLAGGGLAPGLHGFPAELDAEIARTKLATLGIELGEPTQKQRDFVERWNV
ncbi:MAG: adenosylhomocysteinase [Gaiellaceae bacterium MAG52_C11]|nr:adenosylhomocysteinase [Candidatus Gaiellasilicea maunaloa]